MSPLLRCSPRRARVSSNHHDCVGGAGSSDSGSDLQPALDVHQHRVGSTLLLPQGPEDPETGPRTRARDEGASSETTGGTKPSKRPYWSETHHTALPGGLSLFNWSQTQSGKQTWRWKILSLISHKTITNCESYLLYTSASFILSCF